MEKTKTLHMTNLFNTVAKAAKEKGLYEGQEFVKDEVATIARQLCIAEDDAYLLALLACCNHSFDFQRTFNCTNVDLLYLADSFKRLAFENYIVYKPMRNDWSIRVDSVNTVLHDLKPLLDYDNMSGVEMVDILEEALSQPELMEDPKSKTEAFFYRLNRLINSSNPHVISLLEMMGKMYDGYTQKSKVIVTIWLAVLHIAAKLGNVFTSAMLASLLKKFGMSSDIDVPTCILFFSLGEIVEEVEDDNVKGRYYRLTQKYAEHVGLEVPKQITPKQLVDKFGTLKEKRRPFPTADSPAHEEAPVAGYREIAPADIREMELFYNEDEAKKIAKLRNLLMPERLDKAQEQLQQNGGRQGLVFLFYGAPGTGKTESCLQLAKASGRSLFSVDVSQIKSRWVGESEKNLRAIFDDYSKAVRQAKEKGRPFPILLLNEADSIVGKRVDVQQSVDQLNNSLQNILLQEFESTEGVIFCTTNLTNNMDDAFERRFLYKVEFFRPDASTRQQIWKVKLPSLSDEEAASIAGEFDFSGGEIENVARKAGVEAILDNQPLDINLLREYAAEERLKKSGKPNRVGFCN